MMAWAVITTWWYKRGPLRALLLALTPLCQTYIIPPMHINHEMENWCISCLIHLPFLFYALRCRCCFIQCRLRTRKWFLKLKLTMPVEWWCLKTATTNVSSQCSQKATPELNAHGDPKYRNPFSIFLFINSRDIAQHTIFSSCKLAETCTICIVHLFGRDSLFHWWDNFTKLCGGFCLFSRLWCNAL